LYTLSLDVAGTLRFEFLYLGLLDNSQNSVTACSIASFIGGGRSPHRFHTGHSNETAALLD
jgi:hypothetical protein